MQVTVIYYLDIISSWCYWAEPAWAELKRRYTGTVSFQWRIALMDPAGLPASRSQEDWFYRRSGVTVGSPFMLNSGWMEPGATEYLAVNAVAVAARDMDAHLGRDEAPGHDPDRVRLALAQATVREGRRIADWNVCVEIASKAGNLDPHDLLARARSPSVEARMRESTREFHALQVTQRPTFVILDEIGDRAVMSGLVRADPLAATIDAMLADCRAYASWKAHFGDPPA